MISPIHIIGVLLTVILLLFVSWLSGRKVKDERSFTTGGTAGGWMVCGAFLTTLAGGQSTIGTVLTSGAMIGSLFFTMPRLWALIVGALLIMLFVLFGGIRSAGAGGIVKLILLYCGSVATGIVVWKLAGGYTGLRESISTLVDSSTLSSINSLTSAETIHQRYGNMLARGVMKDLGGCLSIVLGVVSTQTYAQCIWSGASTAKARRGALYCAFFIPVIGIACTLVGIFMRGHYVTADELAAMQQAGEALPEGMGILMRDVIANIQRKVNIGAAKVSLLLQTRLSIVLLLAVAIVVANAFEGSFINDLGFLSLGLRAVAIIFPLSFALWLPERFTPPQCVIINADRHPYNARSIFCTPERRCCILWARRFTHRDNEWRKKKE